MSFWVQTRQVLERIVDTVAIGLGAAESAFRIRASSTRTALGVAQAHDMANLMDKDPGIVAGAQENGVGYIYGSSR
jgi:hypothetical protein